MSDSIAILGVKGGPAIRPGSNMPTSILLHLCGKTYLVDAGLGVTKSVCDQGVALTDIDEIFITHLHSDHYLELGPLLHTAWVAGRTRPLTIHGPARLSHYWTTFLQSMEDDIQLRIKDEGRVDLASMVSCQSLYDGQYLSQDNLSIRVMRNDHPPITDSFALRFDLPDRSVVLSGDTAFMPEMIAFARDADVLVHEAMLIDGVEATLQRLPNADPRLKAHILRSHTTAENVGRIASAAGVRKLALNHFVPDGLAEFTDQDWENEVRKTWSGPLILAKDGTVIPL